ncbi:MULTISPECIES: hypothetical protein [unclassified Beijerinckia]|uniref:hypothetical protein n=1 Tax=unclassified Beijerinckia TaxID=2638183 RepID=UPI00089806D2|nr:MULTISPECIES: hypothetical protein [unclassified Beijerinckia]MDH7795477.1 hypothetical protein [Beijerinckia sp. GAS462]SEC03169.1 hypothetical protein SAMN05443249_1752 [Beijerinckia sp. 28-YEA-48]
MKQLVLTAAIVLATSTTLMAQGRPDSLMMTCAQAAGLVRSSGAAVVGTGPRLYDRYVSTKAYCTPMQYIDPAWVATRDVQACNIGYLCKEQTLEFNR